MRYYYILVLVLVLVSGCSTNSKKDKDSENETSPPKGGGCQYVGYYGLDAFQNFNGELKKGLLCRQGSFSEGGTIQNYTREYCDQITNQNAWEVKFYESGCPGGSVMKCIRTEGEIKTITHLYEHSSYIYDEELFISSCQDKNGKIS